MKQLCAVCVVRALASEEVTAEALSLPTGMIDTGEGPRDLVAQFIEDMATGENTVITMTTDLDEELRFTPVTLIQGMAVCVGHAQEVQSGGPYSSMMAAAHRRIARARDLYMNVAEAQQWNDDALWRAVQQMSDYELDVYRVLPNEDVHGNFMQWVVNTMTV